MPSSLAAGASRPASPLKRRKASWDRARSVCRGTSGSQVSTLRRAIDPRTYDVRTRFESISAAIVNHPSYHSAGPLAAPRNPDAGLDVIAGRSRSQPRERPLCSIVVREVGGVPAGRTRPRIVAPDWTCWGRAQDQDIEGGGVSSLKSKAVEGTGCRCSRGDCGLTY